jgi:hypothetical protein
MKDTTVSHVDAHMHSWTSDENQITGTNIAHRDRPAHPLLHVGCPVQTLPDETGSLLHETAAVDGSRTRHAGTVSTAITVPLALETHRRLEESLGRRGRWRRGHRDGAERQFPELVRQVIQVRKSRFHRKVENIAG